MDKLNLSLECKTPKRLYVTNPIYMTRIFDGRLNVHYGQAYILPDTEEGRDTFDAEVSFRGQMNGLCGATIPDKLYLTTGLHTGDVYLSVDVLNNPPSLDQSWEEIIEVPFVMNSEEVTLFDWYGQCVCEIPLSPGTYRVRYCARGMEQGHEIDTILEDEEPVDFYNLAFWPAELTPDTVLKQTSEIAAYWHNERKSWSD